MSLFRSTAAVLLGAALLVTLAGCPKLAGDRANAALPDPDDTAAAAIAEYDANGDGSLSAEEISASPGLVVASKRMDVDGDGQVTEAEISEYLELYEEGGLTLKTVEVTATLDGQLLEGATITLIPEGIQGEATNRATGVTNHIGYCSLASEGAKYPAVQLGLYRIAVSLKEGDRELIPAKYNTETELGVEVSVPAAKELKGGIPLELYSR